MSDAYDSVVGGYTLAGNPFFGGVRFPTVVFGILYAWPWLEQRFLTRDTARHDLLDHPADNPPRTAVGAALFTWVAVVFLAGAADRLFLAVDVPYIRQVWIFRGLVFAAPVVAYLIVLRLSRRATSARTPRGR